MSRLNGNLDAVVIGSGPNGLAAAITLAQAGRAVRVVEGYPTPGGGMRTQELTLPGFWHDVCSAVHPLAISSPFFRSLPLEAFGLRWIDPPIALAHPFDDRPPALLYRSIDATCATLGVDAAAYRRWMTPLVRAAPGLISDVLRPQPSLRQKPFALAWLGVLGLLPASLAMRVLFRDDAARGLLAGVAAHSMLPLERPISAGYGFMLGMIGHAYGWPLPVGGTQRIAESLVGLLRSLGGEVETGRWIGSIDELPPAQVSLWDVTPRQILRLAGDQLPDSYRERIRRYRYGPGVFKLDLALDGPIPWRDAGCAQAATVHLGGSFEEIVASEDAVGQGSVTERPFVLLAQQSLFDPSRAPKGKHTAWMYCHVPNGSTVDMTAAIEAQVERFAPGFRARIIGRHVFTPASIESYDPNYIGGDINGGVQDLFQFYTRPVVSLDPYHVPETNIFLCSSSTPPGGAVHGMCGYWAARSALRKLPARPARDEAAVDLEKESAVSHEKT